MSPPYDPPLEVGGSLYYPEPYSLDPLPESLRKGLIPVGLLATISVGTTLTLICFICYRLATWKLHYRTFLGYNQYVLLVLNLLIADLQQSAAFLFSFHWIRKGHILAPTSPCFAQAWLLHAGDVGSGFFVLAIALHTYCTAVLRKRIGHNTFAGVVAGIWIFTYFLTNIGLFHGKKFFVRAGAWCWISEAYEDDRLALHYIWVFLVQFVTIVIYVVTFFVLRYQTRRAFAGLQNQIGQNPPNMATMNAVNRVTTLMTLYPCVYVLLTLPLSAGRMWSMAHHSMPYSDAYGCVAGAMITSCGWVDSLLYTLTRKKLLRDTMPNSSRRTDSNCDKDLGSKGITHTRTITVDRDGGHGNHMMDSVDPTARARVGMAPATHPDYSDHEMPPSRSESIAPILSGEGPLGKSTTEVSVGLQEILDEERERHDDEEVVHPSGWRWQRHRRTSER